MNRGLTICADWNIDPLSVISWPFPLPSVFESDTGLKLTGATDVTGKDEGVAAKLSVFSAGLESFSPSITKEQITICKYQQVRTKQMVAYGMK